MSIASQIAKHCRALRAPVAGLAALAAGFLSLSPGAALAQAWPNRPVTFIVPFPAGGNTDTMARLLSQKLTEKFGQSFVVENRVGASGAIGTAAVARAAPDGYTLMFGAFQQISVIPYTEKVNYDPKTDLAFVSIFGEGPFVLGVNSSLPVKSLKEFLAYAKSKPGALNYASGGTMSGSHLIAALLFQKAGVSLNHVPYRGGGPAVADLLGGHVHGYFGNASELIPVGGEASVRLIATSAAKRMAQIPDVPALTEIYPDLSFSSWNGVLAPAKTPADILAKLESATIEAARDKDVVASLGKLGIAPVGNSSKDFAARVANENQLMQEAIKAAQGAQK